MSIYHIIIPTQHTNKDARLVFADESYCFLRRYSEQINKKEGHHICLWLLAQLWYFSAYRRWFIGQSEMFKLSARRSYLGCSNEKLNAKLYFLGVYFLTILPRLLCPNNCLLRPNYDLGWFLISQDTFCNWIRQSIVIQKAVFFLLSKIDD